MRKLFTLLILLYISSVSASGQNSPQAYTVEADSPVRWSSIYFDKGEIYSKSKSVVEVESKPTLQPKIEEASSCKFNQILSSMHSINLRANLLHWATTTMNVGVEVRPTSSIGIVLDFDYAPLTWNNGLNGYRAFNFQPQVRYYFGKENNFYAGGEFHVGTLNWKLETRGDQGAFIGGGVVFGYKLPLNDRFDLDFNLGAGYTNYKYDKYMDVDGKHFDYSPNHTKDYWGLTSIGVTLVWKIFK